MHKTMHVLITSNQVVQFIIRNLTEPFLICYSICDALRDLVPYVQFKKREKHSWRSVTFSKVTA